MWRALSGEIVMYNNVFRLIATFFNKPLIEVMMELDENNMPSRFTGASSTTLQCILRWCDGMNSVCCSKWFQNNASSCLAGVWINNMSLVAHKHSGLSCVFMQLGNKCKVINYLRIISREHFKCFKGTQSRMAITERDWPRDRGGGVTSVWVERGLGGSQEPP